MDLETRHLRQLLTQAHQLPEVLLLKQTTTSTNDDVREIALSGVKTVLVCSETQTQGRGQHQREWVSPAGNIYLSTLLETRTPLDGRLALEIALNILQMPSLKGLTGLQIKWPMISIVHKVNGGDFGRTDFTTAGNCWNRHQSISCC